MIIKDFKGCFVHGRNAKFAGYVSVFEAEALGVREALSWLLSLPAMKTIVETDSLSTVNALCKGVDHRLKVGFVLEECRSLLQDSNLISLQIVRRQANKVAHQMACVPCSLNCHNDFMSPSTSLPETIVNDLMG